MLEELRGYGLSEKEALVYLALHKRGCVTANAIAEECDLIRTTTYEVLKSLREKGLASSTEINGALHFEAADPHKMLQTLEEKKVAIERILPALNKLRTELPDLPKTTVYEGKEGVKAVFEALLSQKNLRAYSNNTKMVKLLPYYSLHFISKRVEAKIPIRIISEPSQTTKKILVEKDAEEFRETRVMSALKNTSINQYITEEFVAILSSREEEPVGIIVKHKEFAREQQIIFDALWHYLEENK